MRLGFLRCKGAGVWVLRRTGRASVRGLEGFVVAFVGVETDWIGGCWFLGFGEFWDVEHPVTGCGFPVAHFGSPAHEPTGAFEIVEEFFGFLVGEVFFGKIDFDVGQWWRHFGNSIFLKLHFRG